MNRTDLAPLAARLAGDFDSTLERIGWRAAKRNGRGYLGRCPSPDHGDRTPSCSIRLGADRLIQCRCFGCDFAGDVFTLIAALHGLDVGRDFVAVVRIASELAGGAVLASSSSAPIDPPAMRLDVEAFDAIVRPLAHIGRLDGSGISTRACAYLARRGLLEDAIADGWFAVGAHAGQLVASLFDAEDLRETGLLDSALALKNPTHELAIPWRDSLGRIDTIQRRRLDGIEAAKYLFPLSRGALYPYGVERLTSDALELVIVEGATDVLARRRCRPDGRIVLGVPGVSWSPPSGWKRIVEGRAVWISFDADDAGDRAADRLSAELFEAGARRVIRERVTEAKDWAQLVEPREERAA